MGGTKLQYHPAAQLLSPAVGCFLGSSLASTCGPRLLLQPGSEPTGGVAGVSGKEPQVERGECQEVLVGHLGLICALKPYSTRVVHGPGCSDLNPALPLSCWVTVGKLLSVSEPLSPHL